MRRVNQLVQVVITIGPTESIQGIYTFYLRRGAAWRLLRSLVWQLVFGR